jgi:hypothetical protein
VNAAKEDQSIMSHPVQSHDVAAASARVFGKDRGEGLEDGKEIKLRIVKFGLEVVDGGFVESRAFGYGKGVIFYEVDPCDAVSFVLVPELDVI